jgi:AmmeMemoRadiSam system protein B
VPAEPTEPQGPRRIIIPGEATEEPAPSQVVASELASETRPENAPRIVLPSGSEPEEPELPEYPKLRPLEILPIRDREQDLLLVTDPLGVFRAPVALRLEMLELLQLLDGSVSINELAALIARESKDLRAARFVKDLVGQLDRLLMLDSPRFQEAFAQIRDSYHRLEVRQAALEGVTYPGEPQQAEAFFAKHFEEAEQLRDGSAPKPAAAPTRGLLVPHLDPRRAGAAIARGYLELEPQDESPLRVIVYGVGHALFGDLFALTRKHFETPFGKLACDTRFVDAVAERLGASAYRSELAHRDEHSIEFQAIDLKYRFRQRPLTLVPILCGGFHGLLAEGKEPEAEAEVEALIEAVRETERSLGGATLHVASVDLSHIGARFGDPAPDERTLREVEQKDREALAAAAQGDADGWHRAIAAHQDSTRICGWAATYVMLRCAEPGAGRLLHYHQSAENNGSVVSIATVAWP